MQVHVSGPNMASVCTRRATIRPESTNLALCATPLILPSTASMRPEYFSKNGDICEIGRRSLVNGLQCILLQTLAGSGWFVSAILVVSLLANRLATLMMLWEKLNQLQRKQYKESGGKTRY